MWVTEPLDSRRVDERPHRRTLTPLSSELREPRPPGALTRLRLRLGHRRRPRTLRRQITLALIRLAVATGVGCSLAAFVNHLSTGRSPAFGFYVVGGLGFGVALALTGGDIGTRGDAYFYTKFELETRRGPRGLAFVIAALVVLGIGVALDTAAA